MKSTKTAKFVVLENSRYMVFITLRGFWAHGSAVNIISRGQTAILRALSLHDNSEVWPRKTS